MRTLALAAVSLVALCAAARAADMPLPYKAPPAAPAAGWTGFYLGVNGGGGIGLSRSDFSTGGVQFATVRNTIAGWVGGAQVGYNLQSGITVVGIEADYQFANMTGSISAPCAAALCGLDLNATYGQKMPWFGTVRGRLGVALSGWLFYVTGGYTYARLNTDAVASAGGASANFSAHENRGGYNVGTGIEVMLAGNWSAKLEYLYLDLGTRTSSMSFALALLPPTTVTVVDNARFNMHVTRVGVNYRF